MDSSTVMRSFQNEIQHKKLGYEHVSLCRTAGAEYAVHFIESCRNSYGVSVSVLNFLEIVIKFTANGDPEQRNGFHYPILVYAESYYVNM